MRYRLVSNVSTGFRDLINPNIKSIKMSNSSWVCSCGTRSP